MRWRLRSQLLVPLLLLLAGVAGISTWTAVLSARRARRQIETRVRDTAQYLIEEKRSFRLTGYILQQVKRFSGADFVLVPVEGEPITTLGDGPVSLPAGLEVADDWHALRLGAPVRIDGRTYLCSGIRLRAPNEGDILYILYPESLWRDALWEAVWPSLVLGGALGLASVGLTVGLGQRLSRRIGELERRTRLIAAGDFSPMPLPGRDDELRDLARSVNEMGQRLAQFQKTVEQSERLRLLGQVSGGLAHQLRNGLAGARLAVQLYLRECPAGTDAAALAVALRQLTLLEAHLKRFLDLGRSDAPRREPCALAALVSEAADLLRPQCRHAGIELRWSPPAGPDIVLGDAGQLGQLLLNVLGNAVEAAGPGGWVEVRMRNGEWGMGNERPTPSAPLHSPFPIPHSPFVVVEVLDSGPGPAAEVAERLFEPFVTGKPEGVGLGLAVARQTAEAHGGRITWGREEGRTCFRIELPLEGASGASAPEGQPPDGARGAAKVL